MTLNSLVRVWALAVWGLAGQVLQGQTQVWMTSILKLDLTKRLDFSPSLEQRWRIGEFQHFAELRLAYTTRSDLKGFYEFRAPLNANVRPRHTLAVEQKLKIKTFGTRLADVTLGARYHVNRTASVRYGIYLERKWGRWVPEASAEAWFEQFNPASPLRRTRFVAGINYFPVKKWRASLAYGLQHDFRASGELDETFPVVRLGLRYAP
ncbi:MAG: DUF2490 domain-containing protein [Bacteroidota bacterium]